MLKEIELEKLPSYEIGFEHGIKDGIERATLKNALIMIKDSNLGVEKVVEKLNIDKEKLLEFIKKRGA